MGSSVGRNPTVSDVNPSPTLTVREMVEMFDLCDEMEACDHPPDAWEMLAHAAIKNRGIYHLIRRVIRGPDPKDIDFMLGLAFALEQIANTSADPKRAREMSRALFDAVRTRRWGGVLREPDGE
jgi:hypothetical protein